MDYGTLAQWMSALGAFLSLCFSVFVLRQNNSKDLRSDLSRAFERIDGIELKAKEIEAEVAHLPDMEMMHRLELNYTEMRGDVKRIAEALLPLAASTNRLQEYFFEQAKR